MASPERAAIDPANVPWHKRRPEAWRHAGFRRLTLAWVFSNVADSALYLMVAVWVKELTGSDGAAALVFVMLGVPGILAPVMGQVADRVSRRGLLVAANLAVAAVVTSLLLVDSPAWLWLLYATTFAYGAMGYLSGAAQSGLIRDLLPDEHLASGNGLLTSIDQALRLFSPLLGTGLYALAGPDAVIWLTAACFVVAAVVLARMQVSESPPQSAAERGPYWHEVSAGFRHLANTPLLGRLTLLLALACAGAGLVNAAVFPALEQGMGLPAAALGVVVSCQGVGAVAAGLTAAWAIGRWGERRVFVVGTACLGLGIAPLAGTSLALLVAGLLVGGAGVTWAIVAFMTVRQRLTPPRLQGRTSAAAGLAINLPQTGATALAAALLASVDYRLLLAVTVATVLTAALSAVKPVR